MAPVGSGWDTRTERAEMLFEDLEKSVVEGELGKKTRIRNSGKPVGIPQPGLVGTVSGPGQPPLSGWAVGRGLQDSHTVLAHTPAPGSPVAVAATKGACRCLQL